MKKSYLFVVGMMMGIADLMPGISGATVAYLAGVYQTLLDAIRSLSLHRLKDIPWRVILPLGSGVLLSLLCFSRVLHYLLAHFQLPLFALFFGMILGTSFGMARTVPLFRPSCLGLFLLALLTAFFLVDLRPTSRETFSFLYIYVGGLAASAAMLMPGISGSFVLHLMGLYPILLSALSRGGHLSVLCVAALGMVSGLVLFSRLVNLVLSRAPLSTTVVLMGLMVGACRSLWPFIPGHLISSTLYVLVGCMISMGLESLRAKPSIA